MMIWLKRIIDRIIGTPKLDAALQRLKAAVEELRAARCGNRIT